MPFANYPSTIAEILDDRKTFKPAALAAVRRFARSRPWRGTLAEKKAKFERLNQELAEAYGIACPRLIFRGVEDNPTVGNGYYRPAAHTIALIGKLSVVTYLHEFGHARGYDERKACRFSVNLFRRAFPQSFARCSTMGHVLVRR
jgi:hypothetical protein